MPPFSIEAYCDLLEGFGRAGYRLGPLSGLAVDDGTRTVLLRHDIDLDVPSVLPMARAEAALGVRSTFLVMVTQHYNPAYAENVAVLRELVDAGHEVGLHYDLVGYPADPSAARRRLAREVGAVEELTGVPVRCVSMHQPHLTSGDLFRSGSGLVHPHDPALQGDLVYVSDSCRAWRDETLLGALDAGGPRRLQLLVHPELWLDGHVEDRERYLDEVLLPHAGDAARTYLDRTVRQIWRDHEGALAHDARVARARRESVP
ncbi:MAG: hypothetical protein IE926_02930 [Micrococcales bacterium]|nr:hypothetical protein [Micrococcales bacterium]